MPEGIPRYVRIYDNGGETFDRFTVVYSGRYRARGDDFFYRGMSLRPGPTHPQGYGMSGESPKLLDAQGSTWPPAIGRSCHLGKRIPFSDLPREHQLVVIRDYVALWRIDVK